MSATQSSLLDVLDSMQRDAHASRLNIARPSPPVFDGATFDVDRDLGRLSRQMDRVFNLMRDGRYRTLAEIKSQVGGSEAGISARLRDLRKAKWGAHKIERRRVSDSGLWEYRMVGGWPNETE